MKNDTKVINTGSTNISFQLDTNSLDNICIQFKTMSKFEIIK